MQTPKHSGIEELLAAAEEIAATSAPLRREIEKQPWVRRTARLKPELPAIEWLQSFEKHNKTQE